MLQKEQLEEIEKDKNLLFFIIDILKLKKNNKKTEARAIIPQPPEQKPQSQKANQNDHMNHTLLVVKGHV